MKLNFVNRIYNPFNGVDRKFFYFLLAVPIINAIADSTIYYFFAFMEAKVFHPGITRGIILLLFVALLGFKRISQGRQGRYIILFLAYIFICTLFSSDIVRSFFSGYLKWLIPLLMYSIGIYYIRNYHMLLQLNIFFIFSALITCGNLIIAQFLNYGVSAYADDTFYTGGAGVGITNQLSIILLTYPFLLKTKKDILPKIMWYIIYFIGIISVFLIFMVMKRAAIVGLVVGLLVCLLFLSSRINFIKYIIASIFVLYLIFPFFENAFMTRYESRLRQTENIDREGRVVEFLYALDEFKESDTVQKLFGEEIFNTAATFGIKYFDRGRMIHGDITMFFYGSGLVGIIMYILIYAGLFREGVRYYTVLRRLPVIKDLFAVYFAILISYFAVSVTGSGTIGERCLVFLYLGGITGVLRNIILNIKRERINGSISAGIEKQH